ncbi:MAG: DMT family transporter [Candidatus Staskawiczbacteria bacterium]|nr:DMT family transporter [Candidatus Staskawiczbacteria bacterium]
MPSKKENIGVIFALIYAAIFGIFPIMVNRGTQNIPPLTFASLTTMLAAGGMFLYVILSGKLFEFKKKESYKFLLMIALCIVAVPYSLFFVGASKTSGINSSLLPLTEIIFTLLFTPLIGEKTTSVKLLGAIGIFFGAVLILYNGVLKFNIGDLLIIFSTATYPIGNYYVKKAFNIISPATILFFRFFLGGIFLAPFALFFEKSTNFSSVINNNWFAIVFTGLILLGAGEIIWYEALKRMDISKSISLLMIYPLFSLLILVFILKERPSLFQWLGIIIMGFGAYFSIKRTSVDPTVTQYAP